jgi:prophage regulatory protein
MSNSVASRPLKVLRLGAVKERTGLGQSSIYQMAAQGRFPKQIKIGTAAVGWLEHEITDWLTARAAERR